MAGLNELVREELKLSVQTGFPNLQNFEVTNPTHRELVDDPEFATALGLVLWGSENNNRGGLNDGAGFVKRFFRNLIP